MGQIAATVTDAVDSRIFECLLPDDEELASLASRLAELLHYPVRGPDDYPLEYCFIVKHGGLLPQKSVLGELDLPAPLIMRLVPEISAGADFSYTDAFEKPRQRTMLAPIRVWDVTPKDDIEESSGFDIWIDSSVRKQVERFAREDQHTECAGLLLGGVSVEGNQRVAHITAAIPARQAVGSRTNVRITHGAWESMLGVRDSSYPDARVLGWFHTHAGWGVFMSDSDVFIHTRFFAHPDMVSYVLDPTSERDAFFHWRKGNLAVIGSYGIAYSPGWQIDKPDEDAPRIDWRRHIKWVLRLAAVIAVIVGTYALITSSVARNQRLAAQRQAASAAAIKSAAQSETIYTVTGGETLWRLCMQTYGDGSLAGPLARYNHLKSSRRLDIGAELRLPSREVLRSLD